LADENERLEAERNSEFGRRDVLERRVQELRDGLRERGSIVGRSPDGVDDTIEATLLLMDDYQRRVQELEGLLRELVEAIEAVNGAVSPEARGQAVERRVRAHDAADVALKARHP